MYRSGKDVWPFYCCDPGWSVFNDVSRDTNANSIWDDNNNNMEDVDVPGILSLARTIR